MRVLHIDTGRRMRGGQYQVLLLHDTLAGGRCEQTLLGGDGLRSNRTAGRATWEAVREHARTCDLIHAHDSRAHSLAVLLGRGKPVVVARRVAFPIKGGPASRWKYARAAHFVAISEHVASVLQECGVPDRKISVVYDAAPDPPRDTGRTGRERSFRVVSPNFDDPLKGRELAKASCLRAGIPLHLSDDLQADLRSADALLYLSKSEGLGSAILLGMSMGVPVIASNVGGIPEAVSDGNTGLLVENDERSVSQALLRLKGDTLLRQHMSEKSMRAIRSTFSKKRMADGTLEVYRRVLGQRFSPQA